MIVWGAAELVRKLRLMRQTTAVVAGAVILMLSVTAFNQAAYWKDSYTLYKHSIDTGYANFITYHNMCAVQVGRAEFADAEANCRKAIAAEPRYVEAFGVLGMIYVGQKRSQDAVDAFRKAIEIEPNDPAAYSNLAVPLMVLGETDEAQRSLDTAVELYAHAEPIPRTSPSLTRTWRRVLGLLPRRTTGRPPKSFVERLESRRRGRTFVRTWR